MASKEAKSKVFILATTALHAAKVAAAGATIKLLDDVTELSESTLKTLQP